MLMYTSALCQQPIHIMCTAGLYFCFPGNGHTWLFLINGGEKSFEEEKDARNELKKIYQCFVSNKLVKPEHVVCHWRKREAVSTQDYYQCV